MTQLKVDSFRIYKFHPTKLDPVTVIVEEFRLGASRIIVQCYSKSWTAFWGSHGPNSVERFVLSCNSEYVADNLTWGLNGLFVKRHEKHQYAYLIRIVDAIKDHWKDCIVSSVEP